MKRIILAVAIALSCNFAQKIPAWGDEFKDRAAVIAEYKKWLDSLGPDGSRYWIRLDSKHRPHRLYLAEHPQKFMLIDLFDAATDVPVGEYGFGGFKLYVRFFLTEAK